ncbi:MAG: hypothetical protein ABJL99_05420 [Aliishimia sp.]
MTVAFLIESFGEWRENSLGILAPKCRITSAAIACPQVTADAGDLPNRRAARYPALNAPAAPDVSRMSVAFLVDMSCMSPAPIPETALGPHQFDHVQPHRTVRISAHVGGFNAVLTQHIDEPVSDRVRTNACDLPDVQRRIRDLGYMPRRVEGVARKATAIRVFANDGHLYHGFPNGKNLIRMEGQQGVL